MRHDLATFADLKNVDDPDVSDEAVSDFLLMGNTAFNGILHLVQMCDHARSFTGLVRVEVSMSRGILLDAPRSIALRPVNYSETKQVRIC